MNIQQDQRLGKYVLREPLGHGGMAEVWKAYDPHLQRNVAIKILHANLQTDPEFITRFTREAQVIASLHHPNIVKIYDFQTLRLPESGLPVAYMVMDYIEGRTLAQYIHSTSHVGKFPSPTEILHLFTSISKAIDYAHQKGMIHRDIKPANILLDAGNTTFNSMGEPTLTDFGIARLMDVNSGTVSGMWLGTPLYSSPEQAQGQTSNERSDIYSLGVILYEICTGVQPFRGETATAITWQHIHSLPMPPAFLNPTIPPAMAQVILRALAKDPTERFSSASAMVRAMAEAFHLPSSPTPASSKDADSENTPTVRVSGRFSSGPRQQGQTSPGGPRVYTPSPTPMPAFKLKRKRWPIIVLVALILLLLAGSSIGAMALFIGKHTSSTSNKPFTQVAQAVGTVYFLSSGQVNPLNSQGIDDELQVSLHNVPNPPSSKSYYAWLSSVPLTGEGAWVPLGTLQISQGNAQLPSPYNDPQHANLLLNASSFLVTEESNTVTPTAPSSNQNAWRFYSEPPVLTLTHLRHLLAGSPELAARHLDGGLAIWLLRNTEKLVEWASSARDTAYANAPDTYLIHRQIVHILDYIDGEMSVSTDMKVPNDSALLPLVHDAQIGLLGPLVTLGPPGTTYAGQVPPGYVYLIPVHLNAAVEAPQATAQQRQIAIQVNSEINQVRQDMEQARQDAKQLVNLSGSQLLTPQAKSLLNDLFVRTQSAYTGPQDPTLAQGGATGVYNNIQRMAAFQTQSYTKQA